LYLSMQGRIRFFIGFLYRKKIQPELSSGTEYILTVHHAWLNPDQR